MPRAHAGVLPGATLIVFLASTLASADERPLRARASAHGVITRAAARLAATQPPALVRRPAQQTPRVERRGPGRIVAGAALGAVGGFFAGGYLGAWIDGDCGGCDDPGFKGFLIGAPAGAVTGGILGGKFLF